MHLETILKDLRERFARCELAVSPPLVAFRESVAAEAEAADAAVQRPAGVRRCLSKKGTTCDSTCCCTGYACCHQAPSYHYAHCNVHSVEMGDLILLRKGWLPGHRVQAM